MQQNYNILQCLHDDSADDNTNDSNAVVTLNNASDYRTNRLYRSVRYQTIGLMGYWTIQANGQTD